MTFAACGRFFLFLISRKVYKVSKNELVKDLLSRLNLIFINILIFLLHLIILELMIYVKKPDYFEKLHLQPIVKKCVDLYRIQSTLR